MAATRIEPLHFFLKGFPVNLLRTLIASALLAPPALVLAHEAHTPRAAQAALPPDQQPWGIAGEPRAVRRTIDIAMTDDMRFTPSVIEVREGETVRLRLRNRGKELHELVLGNRATIDEHAEQMKKHPTMEHDDPWMAHVKAGQTGELVWHFNRPGDFDFACLVDDHYELGMAGRVHVRPPR